jgi:hypothetical protein
MEQVRGERGEKPAGNAEIHLSVPSLAPLDPFYETVSPLQYQSTRQCHTHDLDHAHQSIATVDTHPLDPSRLRHRETQTPHFLHDRRTTNPLNHVHTLMVEISHLHHPDDTIHHRVGDMMTLHHDVIVHHHHAGVRHHHRHQGMIVYLLRDGMMICPNLLIGISLRQE